MKLYQTYYAYHIIGVALQLFFKEEYDNIISNTSERNLVGQLSFRLKHVIDTQFGDRKKDYYIDIEFNRKQNGHIKTIKGMDENDNPKSIRITCDLIVHSRGKLFEEDNFIALEMKKSDRPNKEKNQDRNRLMALTTPKNATDICSNDGKTHPEHVCGYLLGVYIELNLKSKNVILEFYEKGEMVYSHPYRLGETLTIKFPPLN